MSKRFLLLLLTFLSSLGFTRSWWLKDAEYGLPIHSSSHQGCQFDPPLDLPVETQLYLILAGGGGIPFDSSGSPGGLPLQKMDVAVNLPKGDVALLFVGASEETLWNIGWTEGTRLRAVALVKLPGGGRQVLAGIPQHIPTFVPQEGPGSCLNLQLLSHFPSFTSSSSSAESEGFNWKPVLAAAGKLFGVTPRAVFMTEQGGSVIVAGRPLLGGERLVTALPPPESFVDRTLLSKDRLALEEALEAGVLSYPSHEDAREWLRAAGLSTPSPDDGGPTSPKGRMTATWGRLYTVRRSFTFPKGLEGGIGFIVPRGVPTPVGTTRGDVEVYDVASGTCRGNDRCWQLLEAKKTVEGR